MFGVAIALAVAAAPAAPEYAMVYGPEPTPSCGTWISVRKNGVNVVARQYEMWVLGLITGMNLRGPSIKSVGPDANALFVWIDQYCASHPLDELLTTTAKLAQELENRTR